MFKKPLIGLAPLLAIAALAVMPVAAQAVTQHWYQNQVLATAGEEIPVVMYGNEVNLAQAGSAGLFAEVNCRTVGGGTIANPVGGAAGVGGMNAAAFYECKGEKCEVELMRLLGVQGRAWVQAENMPATINGGESARERRFVPWFMQLEESTVGGVSSIREKIGEPFVTFKTPSPPGMIRVADECEVVSTGQVIEENIFEGELKPEIGVAKTGNLNGNSAGVPSQMKFNGASTGELHNAAVGEAAYTDNLKYLGYNHQEVITVKP
jgi:hypothetical protein